MPQACVTILENDKHKDKDPILNIKLFFIAGCRCCFFISLVNFLIFNIFSWPTSLITISYKAN